MLPLRMEKGHVHVDLIWRGCGNEGKERQRERRENQFLGEDCNLLPSSWGERASHGLVYHGAHLQTSRKGFAPCTLPALSL